MNDMHSLGFDEIKINKLRALQREGVPAYPYKFERNSTIGEIREQFSEIGHERSGEEVRVAGRLHIIRHHGKTIFADMTDDSGTIQLYIRKNDLGEEGFGFFRHYIDAGDIIGVRGGVFKTKMGEITIWVDEAVLLSKSICPMPEKFHGLKNIETRYRQRYLDLIVNEAARKTFRTRSRFISLLREILSEKGFMEVETPALQPVYGGANARPFTTYHNFLDQKLYLRIAPELYLKRLVVGGFEKIFEIAKNFRNEDIDTEHNPEFSMIEIYEAYSDYLDMMNLTEELISHLCHQVLGTHEFTFGDTPLDLKPPWRRITMEDAVKEYAGIDVMAHTPEELRDIAAEHAIVGHEAASCPGEFLALFFEHFVEEKLIQPVFIHDFPIETSPLAKRHRSKEGFTERFELFIAGMEIANGFSELNDPLDQMARFEEQDARRRHGDPEAQMIDYDFITALGYGMPPTGGVGIGIDRMIMLITGNKSIKEVILFPQMKTTSPEQE